MKAKEKQVKAKDKTGLTSVISVTQPQPQSQKKAKPKTTITNIHKQSEIEIHHWLNYNADRLSDLIKELGKIQRGLKQVASLVRAHYILK